MPYLTAGYPDLETTDLLLGALADAGAVAIELGIPFSDPLADGPALQEAAQVALENGVTVRDVFELARVFAERRETPLIAMTYVNPVLAYGVERFARDARAAGITGVIVSDLPVEERPDVWEALRSGGLDTIPLVAPTTATDRLDQVLARASGFVYCLSRTGVTGDARAFAAELDGLIARVRGRTDVPVGIGFGVSDEAKARFVAARAEAVIVGAAFARRIAETRVPGGGGSAGTGAGAGANPGGPQAVVEAVASFARTLAGAIAQTVKIRA